MKPPTITQVIRLYKDLLRYGQELKHTDKQYFYKRIRKEFKNNKVLANPEEVQFNYQVLFLTFILL